MKKSLNLALQGGGAHGAWTWGVLDRLLDEPDIDLEGISGTSAGAMNAAMLASGLADGGKAQAQKALRTFWQRISALGSLASPFHQGPLEQFWRGFNLDWSLSYSWFDLLSRFLSPYEINPLNINPLRGVLKECLDVRALQTCTAVKVFVAATNVNSGKPRVFSGEELTLDALLASSCIPFLFQAVEIDGDAYWDGGYMGNPALWPLIYRTRCRDILLLQINPLARKEVPTRSFEIINRLNEITFNSSLLAELRAINFVARLVDQHELDTKAGYKRMRMHHIGAPSADEGLTASSKLNTTWAFFEYLHGLGRAAADDWLRAHHADIGVRPTMDVEGLFLRR